jgi:hypothetical protein
MSDYRRERAHQIRVSAADKARERRHPEHRANGDEQRYAAAHYAMSFTKGLRHNSSNGLIQHKADFEAFRRAIDDGFIEPFTTAVRGSLELSKETETEQGRRWEAPTAGLVYDLQGPDAQAVTMAPAPALGSDELTYEMAEVYWLAALCDQPLVDFRAGTTNTAVTDAVTALDGLSYADRNFPGRPRTLNGGKVDEGTVFRGSSPKVAVGPYLSQFMLIGNDPLEACPPPEGEETEDCAPTPVADGYISYGALRIDQRVPVAHEKKDYMTDWSDWLKVQDGLNTRNNGELFDCTKPRRFIITPRDLATYVHDDALYEAYLNACLILIGMSAPRDPAFGQLSGEAGVFLNSLNVSDEFADPLEAHRRHTEGFALYGGPHILTLVTEVATRALKAVRFQKFNTHIRLRPEALAARIEKAAAIEAAHPQIGTPFTTLAGELAGTISAVQSATGSTNALLPMAFQEGSPMHPSYGAGHATVAGACVTILKAFFDTNAVFVRRTENEKAQDKFAVYKDGDQAVQYVPDSTGEKLVCTLGGDFLTLEGELNKLAANISIARNMAGVHYYTDYYDSLRMGEQIAIGILEEQALCYPNDPFIMTLPTFDGEVIRIGAR